MKNNNQIIFFIAQLIILASCHLKKTDNIKVEESKNGISEPKNEIYDLNVLNLLPDSTHSYQPLESKFVEKIISKAEHQYLLGVDSKDSSVVYFAQDLENAFINIDGKLDKLLHKSYISLSEYDYQKNYFQFFEHSVTEKQIQVFTTSNGEMYIYYFDDGLRERIGNNAKQSVSKLRLKLIQANQ